jgi:hypothetical protein
MCKCLVAAEEKNNVVTDLALPCDGQETTCRQATCSFSQPRLPVKMQGQGAGAAIFDSSDLNGCRLCVAGHQGRASNG